jgi:C1A family cysteine protease
MGLELTERFYRPHQDGRLPDMDADQLRYGAHAVVAVGHGLEGADEFLLIRNSWGDGWGDAGHAWLPLSYVGSQLIIAAVLEIP